jgi:dTMP kinase
MDRVILPALGKGTWVLCDRFIDSTMAYQGYARGLDIATLDAVNDFAIYGRRPDLTILLDLDVKEGFQRLEKRYAGNNETFDRFEREAREFHQQVRSGYHALADREPDRFRILDSSLPIDEISTKVWNLVKEVLLR